ncbi:MAG: DUF3365 domain-containing protein [Proteobacteria bacterium]|nr:DUF3365 domain-containing protein [Pseudomonadota bacterium]MCP4916427.1 DUF3365 domain-containing protein [Pseudomonadota bacterium]
MRNHLLAALALVVLGIYLFATAPPPLPEGDEAEPGRRIDTDILLELAAAEQISFRTQYTKDIVGPSLKMGVVFDENWLREDATSGPLPAVALRGIAVRLDRSPTDLALFLGSEHAINRGNRFTGRQQQVFEQIEADKEPRFFYDETQGLHTAMFADLAVAEPCVTCHSEHPKTPKTDWELFDVMGATTWTHPRGTVSPDELMEGLTEVRKALAETYQSFLDRVPYFPIELEIGEGWPADGPYLPSTEVFMREHERRASKRTVELMTRAWDDPE